MNRYGIKAWTILGWCAALWVCGIVGCGGRASESVVPLEEAVQGTWGVDMDATVAAILADPDAAQKDKDEAQNMPDFAREMMSGMTAVITADQLDINTGRGAETMSYAVSSQTADELKIALKKGEQTMDAVLRLTPSGHLQLVMAGGEGDLDKLLWARAEAGE